MSFSNPRVVALAAVAALVSSGAPARDGQGRAEQVIRHIGPYAHDASDIIYEMPPLQPAKRGAVATMPAPRPAATTAAPAPTPAVAAPAPVAVAPPAAATPAQSAPAPVAAPSEPVAAVEPVRSAAPPAETKPAVQAPTAAEPSHMALVPPKPEPLAEPVQVEPPVVAASEKLNAVETPAEAEAKADAPPAVEPKAPEPQAQASVAPETKPDAQAPAAQPTPTAEAPQSEVKAADAAQSQPADADMAAQIDAGARVAALLAQGVKGPAEVRVADRATLWLPAGRVYMTGEAAEKLAREVSFEWRPGVQGLIAPAGDVASWLAPVELLDDGYIKSDEPTALEADAVLAAFRSGLPEINKGRAAGGQPPVELSGWLNAPKLDEKHRVSACVNITPKAADAQGFFNCEAWALGRDGALKVSLADNADAASRLKDETRTLIDAIVFDHGKAYEDVAPADKVAPYTVRDLLVSDVTAKAPAQDSGQTRIAPRGLALALVLLAKFWKLLAFVLVAMVSGVAWLRRRVAKPDAARPDAAQPAVAAKLAEKAEAQSPLARLLPTLHAKFAARAKTSDVASAAGPAAPEVERRKNTTPEKAPGLLARLANRLKKPREEPAQVSPEALKAMATRMRKSAEPSASAGGKKLPGAAPEEAVGDAATAVAAEATVASEKADAKAVNDRAEASSEGFDLVEPGDAEAANAAISAGRALREASA